MHSSHLQVGCVLVCMWKIPMLSKNIVVIACDRNFDSNHWMLTSSVCWTVRWSDGQTFRASMVRSRVCWSIITVNTGNQFWLHEEKRDLHYLSVWANRPLAGKKGSFSHFVRCTDCVYLGQTRIFHYLLFALIACWNPHLLRHSSYFYLNILLITVKYKHTKRQQKKTPELRLSTSHS